MFNESLISTVCQGQIEPCELKWSGSKIATTEPLSESRAPSPCHGIPRIPTSALPIVLVPNHPVEVLRYNLNTA